MKEIKLTKSGEYMCSACKAAPKTGQWHRKWKWKTEKGFIGHSCIVEEEEQRKKQKEKADADYKIKLAEWALKAKYKVCDSVYFLSYYVTKPTHEQRGNRIVKVRYEDERRYCTKNGHIQALLPNGYMILNEHVFESQIGTKEEIGEKVKLHQNEYEEACKFASSVR